MTREEMETKIEAIAMVDTMKELSDADLDKLEYAVISRFMDAGVETFDIEAFHALTLEKFKRRFFN